MTPELIVGTETEGLISYNPNSGTFKEINLNKNKVKTDSNILIRTIDIDDEGNIWYASDKNLLNKIDYLNKKIKSYKPPYYNFTALPFDIRSISINPSGEIWFVSNLGIDIFNPSTEEFKPVPRIMNKKVNEKLKSLAANIIENSNPLSSLLKVGEGENLESSFHLDSKQKVLYS